MRWILSNGTVSAVVFGAKSGLECRTMGWGKNHVVQRFHDGAQLAVIASQGIGFTADLGLNMLVAGCDGKVTDMFFLDKVTRHVATSLLFFSARPLCSV